MSDPELEQRVRQLLAGRAERLDPQLTGPALRARAARPARRVGRIAGPVLAAAAVIVVALAPHLFAGSGHARHVPPGGRPTVGTSVTPALTTSPAPPRPSAAPSSSLPLVPQRLSSSGVRVSPTSSTQSPGASTSARPPAAPLAGPPSGG